MIVITAKVHSFLTETLINRGYEISYTPTISYEELKEKIGFVEGLIVTTRIPVNRELLEKADRLKWIARLGSGMELIDVEYAESRNIKCISSPEGNSNAVAEHALGMLLNVMRNISKSREEIQNKIWLREENRGLEISGKTIGIIGYGNTGSAFVKILSSFDVTVLVYDKYKFGFSSHYIKEASFEQVCKYSDVISLHIPLNAETTQMCSKPFFDKIESSPILINTSRGGIINTTFLIEALKGGKISGAALDVLENENINQLVGQQLVDFNILATHPKVVITPHIAGYSEEAFLNMSKILINKLGI